MKLNPLMKQSFFAAGLFGCAFSLTAQDTEWLTDGGDWSVAGNWSAGVPVAGAAGDEAHIRNDRTANIQSGTVAVADRLQVGFSSAGTLNINAGASLTSTGTSNFGQGNDVKGTVNINGGSYRSTGQFDGTTTANNEAEFNVSGGSLYVEQLINASRGGFWDINITGTGVAGLRQINGRSADPSRITVDATAGGTLTGGGELGAFGRLNTIHSVITIGSGGNFHFDADGNADASTVFNDVSSGVHDSFFGGNSTTLNLDGGNLLVDLTDAYAGTIGSGDTLSIINDVTITGSGFGNAVDGTAFGLGAGLRVNTVGGEGSFLLQFNESGGITDIALTDFQTTLVPEPSTYALLAGLFGLSFVALRRRTA